MTGEVVVILHLTRRRIMATATAIVVAEAVILLVEEEALRMDMVDLEEAMEVVMDPVEVVGIGPTISRPEEIERGSLS
jgi:hypothetical protein